MSDEETERITEKKNDKLIVKHVCDSYDEEEKGEPFTEYRSVYFSSTQDTSGPKKPNGLSSSGLLSTSCGPSDVKPPGRLLDKFTYRRSASSDAPISYEPQESRSLDTTALKDEFEGFQRVDSNFTLFRVFSKPTHSVATISETVSQESEFGDSEIREEVPHNFKILDSPGDADDHYFEAFSTRKRNRDEFPTEYRPTHVLDSPVRHAVYSDSDGEADYIAESERKKQRLENSRTMARGVLDSPVRHVICSDSEGEPDYEQTAHYTDESTNDLENRKKGSYSGVITNPLHSLYGDEFMIDGESPGDRKEMPDREAQPPSIETMEKPHLQRDGSSSSSFSRLFSFTPSYPTCGSSPQRTKFKALQ